METPETRKEFLGFEDDSAAHGAGVRVVRSGLQLGVVDRTRGFSAGSIMGKKLDLSSEH